MLSAIPLPLLLIYASPVESGHTATQAVYPGVRRGVFHDASKDGSGWYLAVLMGFHHGSGALVMAAVMYGNASDNPQTVAIPAAQPYIEILS